MMKKIYDDDCLSRSRIHEWFKRFQERRKALEDDERSRRPRNAVNEENAEIVSEFIRKEPKSSLVQALGKSPNQLSPNFKSLWTVASEAFFTFIGPILQV